MVVLFSVAGCVGRETSSKEEALYATRALPECREIIHYISVMGKEDVILRQDSLLVNGIGPFRRVHVVVYVDDKEKTQVATWDDQRPPQRIRVK